MQMAQDGGKYYLLLAENCQVEGIATIFTMLANEEVKHYNTIVHLLKNAGNSSLVKTTVLENVKNIFVRMKEEKANVRIDSSELESYRKAMSIEEMSWKFISTRLQMLNGIILMSIKGKKEDMVNIGKHIKY